MLSPLIVQKGNLCSQRALGFLAVLKKSNCYGEDTKLRPAQRVQPKSTGSSSETGSLHFLRLAVIQTDIPTPSRSQCEQVYQALCTASCLAALCILLQAVVTLAATQRRRKKGKRRAECPFFHLQGLPVLSKFR